jgi:nitrite reductase/ring-hydroxylating ferredoxin subunit
MPFSKLHIFFITILFLLATDGCKKKEDLVPNVYVNFTIFLSDPEFATLQTIGNSVFVTGGVSGIIIYRYSQSDFTAIERCCSYQPNERCAVLPDTSNSLFLKCPCCNSKFSILDGSIQSGPAERPLTTYEVSYDGSNSIHVYN